MRDRQLIIIDALQRGLSRLRLTLRFHAVPLAVVAVVVVLGQAATLLQTPLSYMSWDTFSYVSAAAQLTTHPPHLDAIRTVGYPLFLVVVFALSGGVDYTAAFPCNGGLAGGTPRPECQALFAPVLVTQTLLFLLTIILVYVLTFRLTSRRVTACLVACLIGSNLFITTWERAMQSELLSIFFLVLTFVVYERLVRQPRPATAIGFAAVLFVDILVRPFNLGIALVLFALLALRLLFLADLRKYLRPVALSAALLLVCMVGYMGLAARQTHIFGLTWITNLNLLGKVLEYHIEGLEVDPQYAGVQSEVQAFVQSPPAGYDPSNPWGVGAMYPDVAEGGYSKGGGFASNVIRHHPVTFLVDSIPDIIATWQAQPVLYGIYGHITNGKFDTDPTAIPGITGYPIYGFGVAPTSDEPWWVNALLVQSTLVLDSYWMLPLIVVVLALAVWRRRKDPAVFVMLALAVSVVSGIVLTAAGSFEELYRLRAALDWGMIVLAGIVGVEAVAAVWRLPAGSGSSISVAARSGRGSGRGGDADDTESDTAQPPDGDGHSRPGMEAVGAAAVASSVAVRSAGASQDQGSQWARSDHSPLTQASAVRDPLHRLRRAVLLGRLRLNRHTVDSLQALVGRLSHRSLALSTAPETDDANSIGRNGVHELITREKGPAAAPEGE